MAKRDFMTHYSIKDLSQLSGIKAHTIRIWEKRYDLISPKRTDTNIRYYSDQDLRKILNVSFLNNNGLKISKIANLSATELTKRVSDISVTSDQLLVERSIDELIFAMIALDEARFATNINQFTEKMGFENAMVQVIYPFLMKIGVLWQTGNINPAQEHFVSSLIRQKLISAIDKLPINDDSDRPLALLFLQENELHELGLLFSHYIVRKSGYRTVYLGQHMPYTDVLSVKAVHSPDLLITYILNPIKKIQTQAFVDLITQDFDKSKVLFSISNINSEGIKMPSNGLIINSVDELRGHLDQT